MKSTSLLNFPPMKEIVNEYYIQGSKDLFSLTNFEPSIEALKYFINNVRQIVIREDGTSDFKNLPAQVFYTIGTHSSLILKDPTKILKGSQEEKEYNFSTKRLSKSLMEKLAEELQIPNKLMLEKEAGLSDAVIGERRKNYFVRLAKVEPTKKTVKRSIQKRKAFFATIGVSLTSSLIPLCFESLERFEAFNRTVSVSVSRAHETVAEIFSFSILGIIPIAAVCVAYLVAPPTLFFSRKALTRKEKSYSGPEYQKTIDPVLEKMETALTTIPLYKPENSNTYKIAP